MKIEKRKEYLRSLPTGKKFSASEISAICTEYHLVAPVEFLIAKGDECNWLTSQGNSFQSAKSFSVNYNGVFLEEKRKQEASRDNFNHSGRMARYKIIESEDGKTFEELQEAAVSSLNSCMKITKKNVSSAILEAVIQIAQRTGQSKNG